jgi:hypothetical protein
MPIPGIILLKQAVAVLTDGMGYPKPSEMLNKSA